MLNRQVIPDFSSMASYVQGYSGSCSRIDYYSISVFLLLTFIVCKASQVSGRISDPANRVGDTMEEGEL